MISRRRAVLFDLDGTLLDSIPLILDSYAHTFTRFGLSVPSREALIADIGRPLQIVLGPVAADPARLADMIAVYREYNLAHHDARAAAFPGVVAMVREVRDLGFRTALVTSKIRDSAGHGLRLLGLEAVIDCVVGADQVAEPKPAAEPVLRAASLLGVAPGDAIMVGDSAHDMASGRAAGAQTAAALWGAQDRAALAAAAPDYWLNDPPDLVPLLQSTLSAPAPP